MQLGVLIALIASSSSKPRCDLQHCPLGGQQVQSMMCSAWSMWDSGICIQSPGAERRRGSIPKTWKEQCERCALLNCFTRDSEGTSRSHLAPEIPLQESQHHDVNLYSGFHLQCHAHGHQSVAVKDVPSLLCSHIVSYTGVCQVCHINESKVSVLCSIYHSGR